MTIFKRKERKIKMTKPEYFESERRKELPYLEASVLRYDMMFIDTSSVMSPHFARFAANIIPYLKQYNKKLTVCESVLRELKRLKQLSSDPESLVREVYSYMGLYVLDRFIEHGVLEYINDGIEQGPADLAFQKLFISLRPKKRLLLITQDVNLTETILRFNLDRAVFAEPIGVKQITQMGMLDPRSKLPLPDASQTMQAAKPVNKRPVLTKAAQVKAVPKETPKMPAPPVPTPPPKMPVPTSKPVQARPAAISAPPPRLAARTVPKSPAQPLPRPQQKSEENIPGTEPQNPTQERMGSGAFTARDAKNIPGTDLHVPVGYTSVGFIDRSDITMAFLPETVTTIAEQAFRDCMKLAHIAIPDTVTAIEASAFSNCRSLQSIRVPSKVRAIKNGTFKFCYSLKDVYLPDGLQNIGSIAFKGCTQLRSITIPDSVMFIGKNAFSSCPNLVIRCSKGSCAHAYAESNGIKWTEA